MKLTGSAVSPSTAYSIQTRDDSHVPVGALFLLIQVFMEESGMPTYHTHEKPPLPHPTSDTELIQLYRKIIRILKELDAARVDPTPDASEPATPMAVTPPSSPTPSTHGRQPDVAN